MRPLVAALFSLAVAATVLAGDGLVLVPHAHGPGTPTEHPHGLALYRFPIALLGDPADAPRVSTKSDATASFRMTGPASETLAGMTLLLIAALLVGVIAVVRPFGSRAIPLGVIPAGWVAIPPTGPPRLLPSA